METTTHKRVRAICGSIQLGFKQMDLSNVTIEKASKILVDLYEIKRLAEKFFDSLPQTPVYSNGKIIGYLFEDESIEGIILSTRIELNFWIQACESEIRRLTNHLIVKRVF